jgi:hypothetical protein
MARPKNLKLGIEGPAPSPAAEEERIAVLRATVQQYLPEFAKSVAKMANEHGPIGMHQDAFAAAYDDDEYTLLGMAIKYAGLHGVQVTFHGKNQETSRQPPRP